MTSSCLMNADTLEVRNVLKAGGVVTSWDLFNEGQSLAAVSADDWKIRFWDLHRNEVSRTLPGLDEPTTYIRVSPDGKHLIATGKSVKLWTIADGSLKSTLFEEDGTPAAFSASFSPDGRHVAVSCNDSQTRIWNVETGERIHTLKSSQPNVFSVCYSPDGRMLITRSMAGLERGNSASVFMAMLQGSDVCLWNVAEESMAINLGGPICVMEPHSYAWSPDGTTIAATRNKAIGIWYGSGTE